MDNIDHSDLPTSNEDLRFSSSLAKVKNVTSDTRSREAFELLKLGEAICSLQVDQRKMRLSVEDLRFERDRYKSSAAAFQNKLNDALHENSRLRDLRDIMKDIAKSEQSSSFHHQELSRINIILADKEQDIQRKSYTIQEIESKLGNAMAMLNDANRRIEELTNDKINLVNYAEELRKYCVEFFRDLSS